MVSSGAASPLTLSSSHDPAAALAQSRASGERAAAMNADSGNADKYGAKAAAAVSGQKDASAFRVLRAAAAVLPEGSVVDTTGAGDSFIGSVVYGLATGLDHTKMLQVRLCP